MAEEARIAAVILAAGRGARMGGPKGLLLLHDRPLVLCHVDRFLEAGCDEVIVVAHEDVATLLLSTHDRVRVVVSKEPEPRGSLAVGVRAVERAARVLVTPVDAAPASLTTIHALLTALDSADAATPTLRGRGGHPVACRARALSPYRDGAPGDVPTLRECLASLGPRRVRVEVDDEAVGIDLDRPEDVERLTGAKPAFWGQR